MSWTGNLFRLVLLLWIWLLSACASSSYRELLLNDGIHNIDGYIFDPSSSVESRIATIPAATLKLLMQSDKRSGSTPYMPTAAETRMFAAYLKTAGGE